MKIRLQIVAVVLALSARAQLPPFPPDALPATASISGVVVRAADEASARAGLAVVTQIHAKVCALLCVTTAPPSSVGWFTDKAVWDRYIGKSGAHILGKGVSALGAVAIYADGQDANEPLAHELVHQVLKNTSKAPLPLWFEEGSAACFGWMAAKEYSSTPEKPIQRRLPPIDRAELLSSDVMLKSRDYPEALESNRAFYRQSEELVRLLYEALGPEGFRRLTVELAKNNDLRLCLEKNFSYSVGGWQALTSAMFARATTLQRR